MRIFYLPALFLLCLTVVGCGTATSIPDEVEPSVDTGAVADAAPGADNFEVQNDYILGQGDTISIQVFDEPDLTLSTAVGTSGSINYSYLGDIKVAGKSPSELERLIAGMLQDGYLVNPSVNVTVTQYRPFYINGEVRSPGGYPYQPGLTLDKAIALAGGLTDRASTRKMFVTKGLGGGQTEEGSRVFLNSRIAPGDIITIKEGFF